MHADLSAALFMISSACTRDRSSASTLAAMLPAMCISAASRLSRLSPAPDHADQLSGDVGCRCQIGRDAGGCLAVLLDLGGPAGEGDDDEIAQLRRRARCRSSPSSWATRPSEARATKDRSDAHVATDQHGDHRVPRFVDGDAATLLGLVADVLGEADLGDQLRLDEIFDVERLAPVAKGDDQRLVEQPLDAHRAVARPCDRRSSTALTVGSCDFLSR